MGTRVTFQEKALFRMTRGGQINRFQGSDPGTAGH